MREPRRPGNSQSAVEGHDAAAAGFALETFVFPQIGEALFYCDYCNGASTVARVGLFAALPTALAIVTARASSEEVSEVVYRR